jgi:hypothetical protein
MKCCVQKRSLVCHVYCRGCRCASSSKVRESTSWCYVDILVPTTPLHSGLLDIAVAWGLIAYSTLVYNLFSFSFSSDSQAAMEPFQLILCLCVSAKARERTWVHESYIWTVRWYIKHYTFFVLGQILLNDSRIAAYIIMHFFLCIVVLILCVYALMLSIIVCLYMRKINKEILYR